jgi:hypothetical protein
MSQTYRERELGLGTIIAVVVVIALVALLVWGFAFGGFYAGTAPSGAYGTTGTIATPAAPGGGTMATPAAPYGGGTAPTKP